MKNINAWVPGKFVMTKKGLRASRNQSQVGIGSRFIGDLQAKVYEEIIRVHTGGELLDLGCGTVPLYEIYREYITDNICIDWIGSFHKTKHLDFECDLNLPLPLEDNRFDTILVTDVLEHINDVENFWHESSRVLKQGGKIILTVPFLYWLHEEPYDYARYSEHRLSKWCREYGLEILSLEPYGGPIEVICDIIAKLLIFSRMLSTIHFMVSKGFNRLFRERNFYKRISRRFPLGYYLVAEKTSETDQNET